jgi:hypothetical protein
MKKIVSLLLAVALATSCLLVTSYADDLDVPVVEEFIEEYAIFDNLDCILSINNGTATCTSQAISASAQTITAVQTLEKYSGWFWVWDTVSGATWSKTRNGTSLTMQNNKGGLSSGTYRLKTVFTVTSTSGQTETVTVYSSERTVS